MIKYLIVIWFCFGASSSFQKGRGIFQAAYFGNEDVARKLVGDGIDVNTANEDGETPLYFAVRMGHARIVDLLATNGADVNKEIEGIFPLFLAAKKGHAKVIDVLAKHNASLDITDYAGHTALHIAASLGYEKSVAVLISHLPSLMNAIDRMGKTALHCASILGRAKTVKVLIDNGADIFVIDNRGKKARDYARYKNIIAFFDKVIRDGKQTSRQ